MPNHQEIEMRIRQMEGTNEICQDDAREHVNRQRAISHRMLRVRCRHYAQSCMVLTYFRVGDEKDRKATKYKASHTVD